MQLSEMKEKLEQLEKLKDDALHLVNQVNGKTRDIKYMDTPSEIYMAVESLAEDNGIDISYEVDAVREAVNKLESAIYNLVEPFEDKARDFELEYDELEWDIEDAA
jgi:DNA repair ATPase RecN